MYFNDLYRGIDMNATWGYTSRRSELLPFLRNKKPFGLETEGLARVASDQAFTIWCGSMTNFFAAPLSKSW
jgi:hypothetical protein